MTSGTELEHDKVIPTAVPGIVLWRYPRTTLQTADGPRRRYRYVVTHEPSSWALLAGTDGAAKAASTVADGRALALQLGDVRWRGKRFDWTQPLEVLRANDRARQAAMLVAGWRVVIGVYDKATREWAERNGINLELGATLAAIKARAS